MSVEYYTVTPHEAGQRVDNFLFRYLKSVPKSAVYRILRKGEVRVDKKRVKPEKKLVAGEVIRIPPLRLDDAPAGLAPESLLAVVEQAVLHEDEHLIFINKPAGLPVHGGSGHPFGLIEVFRQLRPHLPFVELAHRIDADTSGIVVLTKSRPVLLALHELLRTGGMDKRYLALVTGKWTYGRKQVTLALGKDQARQQVRVADDGKEASTIFAPVRHLHNATLLEAQILTGRMHQIRVQLQHLGHPILGDERYGDFALNRQLRQVGLKRLFLHAANVSFMLELAGRRYTMAAPLPAELQAVLDALA